MVVVWGSRREDCYGGSSSGTVDEAIGAVDCKVSDVGVAKVASEVAGKLYVAGEK